MLRLGVNIDHVATLRQARYRSVHGAIPEPDPLWAAVEVELAITWMQRDRLLHVRERPHLITGAGPRHPPRHQHLGIAG